LPAIIEASESGLPLVAITADRPTELHDCGAPQTLDQARFFGAHVRAFYDLGEPAPEITPRWLARIAAQAVDAATGALPGPVHLNVRFRKPLWEPGLGSVVHLDAASATPRVVRSVPRVSSADLDALSRELSEVERGVIVCGVRDGAGVLADVAFAPAVARLSRQLGWPVFAEPGSQVRFGPHDRECLVEGVDALLRNPQVAAAFQPDRVLRFGRSPLSGALSTWLAHRAPDRVIAVNETGAWLDAERILDRLIVADPVDLCDRLADSLPLRSTTWLQDWKDLSGRIEPLVDQATREAGWAGHVVRSLLAGLPDGTLLHVASSMAVRDLDSFGPPTSKRILVSCNRGANGIDGTLSTALGQALAWTQGPVAVLLGDLAFLHDAGALRTLKSVKVSMPIVVVDNGGGGIFEYLPVEASEAFGPLFLTPQDADIPALAKAAGVPCTSCPQGEGLEDALSSMGPGPHLLYVPVDRALDRARHVQFWSDVAAEAMPLIAKG
jgi:2-succinyl-5-enolpyruvyl-6-hydroxy-3-cyclohexene-1-carboxylate synthase